MESEPASFVAPLGQARSGRLVFLSGASGIALIADPAIPDMARGDFTRPVPRVEVKEGRLVLQYGDDPCPRRQTSQRGSMGEVRLNPTIPWEIEFHDRLSGLTADLRDLQLRSLDILGSAKDVTLNLSRPATTGFLYISGDTRQVSIRRPHGAGVRLSALGGITNLSIDGRNFPFIEGEARLESDGFSDSTTWYEIGIAGSAEHWMIEKE
jgi:hypothetical protein